ncbi:hypothetical protein [Sporosarcina luteola]|uniref:hypothetical protein n=1 Tax=Sporosarcina luteola TaxID=582850 RepID=UPI002040DD56|nr:hypothetical protein [Sporosarcina luteola]MCM3709166.1 hypothetical protein [Sporosarcina luteola]
MKITTKKLVVSALLTGIVLSTSAGTGMVQAESIHTYSEQQQTTKYPKKVMEAVRQSLGVDKHSTEVDTRIEAMPQVEVMDKYLDSFGKKIKGNEVREAVRGVFNIDLDEVSKNNYGNKLISYNPAIMQTLRDSEKLTDAEIMKLAKVKVMDAYIKAHGYDLTGAENRVVINQIFGVNLDGISGIAGLQLGINSKGIWIINTPTDMLVISSSLDDVELYVYTTDYWEQITGTKEVPDSLKQYFADNGFTYDDVTGKYIWVNPTGESAPEAIKSQTIGTLIQTIMQVNASL